MPSDQANCLAPCLKLEDYFAGRTRAWGVFLDRFGTLRRQFEVDASGTWDGQTLRLDERFTYDDGQKEKRVWDIEKIDRERYRGRVDDMIGSAEGSVHGNSIRWTYRFRLCVGQSLWTVRFDDRYVLLGDGVLLYRAKVSKFRIALGNLTMVFIKL